MSCACGCTPSFRRQTNCDWKWRKSIPHWGVPRRSAGTVVPDGGTSDRRSLRAYYHLAYAEGTSARTSSRSGTTFSSSWRLRSGPSTKRSWTTLDSGAPPQPRSLLRQAERRRPFERHAGARRRLRPAGSTLKHGRTGEGHTFKNRFFSKQIADESQFLALCAYIALNPVEAGLCADPADWEWSRSPRPPDTRRRDRSTTSARCSGTSPTTPARARARYVRLVDDALWRAAVVESAA